MDYFKCFIAFLFIDESPKTSRELMILYCALPYARAFHPKFNYRATIQMTSHCATFT